MKIPNLMKMDFILIWVKIPNLTTFGVVLGGFHGGFFIWDELEKVCGRKMSEKCKILHFLGKNP